MQGVVVWIIVTVAAKILAKSLGLHLVCSQLSCQTLNNLYELVLELIPISFHAEANRDGVAC
jgi:hypothetical protein